MAEYYMATMFFIALIGFLNSLVALAAPSEAVCSLAVKVVNNSGSETPARVEVREQDGTTHVRQNKPGGVEFCSLGLLPVDLSVGDGSCNLVTIKNVPLRYGKQIIRVVSYDTESCQFDALPSSYGACFILIRVFDERGTPVPDARFSYISPQRRTLNGDNLGRALAVVSVGQSAVIDVSARAESQRLNLDCAKEGEAERKVIVRRGSGQGR